MIRLGDKYKPIEHDTVSCQHYNYDRYLKDNACSMQVNEMMPRVTIGFGESCTKRHNRCTNVSTKTPHTSFTTPVVTRFKPGFRLHKLRKTSKSRVGGLKNHGVNTFLSGKNCGKPQKDHNVVVICNEYNRDDAIAIMAGYVFEVANR